MSANIGHAPPSSGAKILEAVEQLSTRLDDKYVREQHRDDATGQILLELRTLTSAVKQLQIVVRSEQEHTRRALLMHFGAEGLEKARGE
jgi:hypothetical protein